MKHAELGKIVEEGMKRLVSMGMPYDYEIRLTETGKFPDLPEERQSVEVIIDPFEKHSNYSYLRFVHDQPKKLIDMVGAGLRKGLEKDFAEPAIYILGGIGKTLGCEWMQTTEKHVAQYGPWAEVTDEKGNGTGIYRINVDLFMGF